MNVDTTLDLESANEKIRLSGKRKAERLSKAASTKCLVDTTSIVAIAVANGDQSLGPARRPSLEWYSAWLNQRLASIPPWISDSIASMETATLMVVAFAKEHRSLADIVDKLTIQETISSKDATKARTIAMTISFALLGWLSMLYEPELGETRTGQIAISDVLDGYRSTAYFQLTQAIPDGRLATPEILLGFGLMLPKENVFTGDDGEDAENFEKTAVLSPGVLNAANLISLAGLKFQWVDVIAPHLELDQATNTIFIYRYPSFCLANLPPDTDSSCIGVIHSLAQQNNEPSDTSQWGSEASTTGLLREILLSYRLLFAQDKASRRILKSTKPFDEVHPDVHDPFLRHICTERTLGISSLAPDRECYRLTRDFPVLRERLAVLQQQLRNAKPRGWKAVWADKRDSVQWWTFWAVIFFGGAGLILSAMQVGLQFAQLFMPQPA